VDFSGYGILRFKRKRNGIAATRFKVEVTDLQQPRNFNRIKELISQSRLAREVKDLSIRIFH